MIENNEPHSSGGGFYAIFKFAQYLEKRGHSIFIYAVHDHHWISKTANLQIYYRPKLKHNSRFSRKFDKLFEKFFFKYFVLKLAKKFQPHWILGVFTHSAIKAVQLGEILRIPVANFVYECPPWLQEVFGPERYAKENLPYIRKLWENTRTAYLNSQILFPNSKLSQSYNSKWLNGKEVKEPIYPGLDISEMHGLIPKLSSLESNNTSAKKKLLYIGRLSENKNVDLLVKVMTLLKSPVELHVCGSGPEIHNLRELAKNSKDVFIHGFVSDTELWSHFRNTDLVLYPSSFEGFGMPPMQALFFKKICLASDLPVLRSIYGNYIQYFNLAEIKSLANSIETLLFPSSDVLKSVEEGHQYVLKTFTWEKSAENVEHTLLEWKPQVA